MDFNKRDFIGDQIKDNLKTYNRLVADNVIYLTTQKPNKINRETVNMVSGALVSKLDPEDVIDGLYTVNWY